jgi:hypothetical protein
LWGAESVQAPKGQIHQRFVTPMRWNKGLISAPALIFFPYFSSRNNLENYNGLLCKNNKRHSKILKRYPLNFLLGCNARLSELIFVGDFCACFFAQKVTAEICPMQVFVKCNHVIKHRTVPLLYSEI